MRNTKIYQKSQRGKPKKLFVVKIDINSHNIEIQQKYVAINYNNVTKKSENIYKPSMQAQTFDRRGGNEKGCGL